MGTIRSEAAPPAPNEAKVLAPGFVRGDVVSHSYVPIRTWTPKEGISSSTTSSPASAVTRESVVSA